MYNNNYAKKPMHYSFCAWGCTFYVQLVSPFYFTGGVVKQKSKKFMNITFGVWCPSWVNVCVYSWHTCMQCHIFLCTSIVLGILQLPFRCLWISYGDTILSYVSYISTMDFTQLKSLDESVIVNVMTLLIGLIRIL